MTQQIAPVKRALTSASNLYRRLLCPGSARLEKDLPDIKSKESVQGERLHDYSAHPEYERAVLSPVEQDLLRTADQLEAEAFDAIGIDDEYEDYHEHYLVLGDDSISGHVDLMRLYDGGELAVVVDRKFGWAPVERADTNLQMRIYAILAPRPEVYVVILQPRAHSEDRITIAKYDAKSKEASLSQIRRILARSEDPDAPLVPGEAQCRYCKARATCPALQEAITKELVIFEDLSAEELSKPALLGRIEARLAQASDVQLGALHNACALARLVNDPMGEEIRRRINNGGMEGWRIGKEIEVRSITNTAKAISRLVLGRLFARSQLLDQCDLSITRVESLYRKLNKGMSEKQARADINKALADTLERDTRKGRILRP